MDTKKARPAMTADRGLVYRPELDGIRGIAILLVVLAHAGSPRFGWAGVAGVTLFFVLSGYLITSLLAEERLRTGRINLARFYIRRGRRLLPALAVFLVAAAVLGWARWDALAAIALYGANVFWAFGGDLVFLRHTWTLAIEEQFYLLWPLVFIAGLRSPRVLFALAVAVIAFRFAIQLPVESQSVARIDGLLVGCAMALARLTIAPRVGWLGLLVLVLVSVAPPFIIWSPPYGYASNALVVTLAAVAVVGGARAGWLSARPLVWFGGISYALYLWHFPLIYWSDLDPLVATAISVPIAWASTRYIEGPFRRRRNKDVGQSAPPIIGKPQPQISTGEPLPRLG